MASTNMKDVVVYNPNTLTLAPGETFTATGSGTYTGRCHPGLPTGYYGNISSNTYTYLPSTSTVTHYTPWISEEDGWGSQEAQDAAGQGWMLVDPATAYTSTPHLVALSWGAKKDKTPEAILTDVLEQAVCGASPIAYKILQVLSKNRSPYAEYADTVKVLAETYEG